MSKSIHLTVLSIVLAVCFGVAFKTVYPAVPIDGALSGLFALCGVATASLIFGLCKLVSTSQNKKTAP